MKLYFAYGSNLHVQQMIKRCPDARPLMVGNLTGYRLTFARVLTVEQDPKRRVPGAIYQISERDEKALDRYEGYPRLYGKRTVTATIGGVKHEVMFYVLNSPYTISPPSERYYNIVAQGYHEWGINPTPLEKSLARATSKLA